MMVCVAAEVAMDSKCRAELFLSEALRGDLPPCCVKCGETATVYLKKTYSTLPLGLLLMPFPGGFIYAGKMFVKLPFCESHRNYWRNQALIRWLGFVAIIGVFVISLVIAAPLPKPHVVPVSLFIMDCVGLLAWLIGYLVMHFGGIRLVTYNNERLVLGGVAPRFREALDAQHAKRSEILQGFDRSQRRDFTLPDGGSTEFRDLK
jgi:hypothetical protein